MYNVYETIDIQTFIRKNINNEFPNAKGKLKNYVCNKKCKKSEK